MLTVLGAAFPLIRTQRSVTLGCIRQYPTHSHMRTKEAWAGVPIIEHGARLTI
jgi:hypothetical protein